MIKLLQKQNGAVFYASQCIINKCCISLFWLQSSLFVYVLALFLDSYLLGKLKFDVYHHMQNICQKNQYPLFCCDYVIMQEF